LKGGKEVNTKKSNLVEWRMNQIETMEAMQEIANKRRKQRSWERINESIERGDEEMLLKLEQLENL